MSIRRFARAILALTIVVSASAAGAPAFAQEPSGVTLTLVSQTPWTTPKKDPILEIVVQAHNGGTEVVDEISMGITIGAAVRSRDEYEASLTQGPGSFPVSFKGFPVTGTLDPGESRTFSLSVDLSKVVDISSEESLVYPAAVDLRTRGVPIAALNTPVLHIVRKPQVPVLFTWWAEVTSHVAMDPQGRLSDPAFETSIAPGGTLASEAGALERLATDPDLQRPATVVIEPALLDQLTRMADGYERADGTQVKAETGGAADARTLLEKLRTAVAGPETTIVGMPFSAPEIPALLSSNLGIDYSLQWRLGDATLSHTLGATRDPEVLRPPHGALDDAAVDRMTVAGVTTILADALTVDRPPQPNFYAPTAVADLSTPSAAEVSLVLPDPGATGMLANDELLADPIRTAQAVLCELAVIWKEQPVPVPGTVRGLALALPARLPPGIWGPLTRRLAQAPFLRSVPAQDLVADVRPAPEQAVLATPSTTTYSSSFVDAIRGARRDVRAFESMLGDPGSVPGQLRRDLFYAEAGDYAGDDLAARPWIDEVNDYTDDVFSRVQPSVGPAFTFTSRTGTVPLRMGDPGEVPLTVVVQLRSSWFRFPDGDTQTITLERPNQTVTFHVEAQAAAQRTIEVIVRSPSGRAVASETIVVRSTVANRIALIITGAAALILVGLWSRRLFRRTKT